MSTRLLPSFCLAALIAPAFPVAAAGQPDPAWIYEAPRPSPNVEHRNPRRLAEDIGTLSMMTPSSRNAVLAQTSGDRVYDLSVRYFIGLPSWYGLDDLPPIIARGVLIDVAGLKNVAVLPDAYRITRGDLETALTAQRVALRAGDIVLIRGGKITLEAAEWLAEAHAAMIIGGDYLSLEQYRIGRPDMTVPVHKYLLRERGIAIIQVANLDELARDRVYEFAFIAAALRPRGAAGFEFRPLAFPLHPERR
jgi:putative cyclase